MLSLSTCHVHLVPSQWGLVNGGITATLNSMFWSECVVSFCVNAPGLGLHAPQQRQGRPVLVRQPDSVPVGQWITPGRSTCDQTLHTGLQIRDCSEMHQAVPCTERQSPGSYLRHFGRVWISCDSINVMAHSRQVV